MEKTLTKKAFPQWIKKLAAWKVYVPRNDEEGRWNYVENLDGDVVLDTLQTTLPPKKILFPQNEPLLEFASAPLRSQGRLATR
jgi:GAF domain-containing protein